MRRSDDLNTRDDRPPDALDRAIECTLREIVALDAPERLTARVMARIEARDDARRTFAGFTSWSIVAGVAAAAVIVIGIASSMRSGPTPESAPNVVATAPPSVVAPKVDDVPAIANSIDASRDQQAAIRRTRAPRPRTETPMTSTLESIAIDALAAPDPIAIHDIAPSDLNVNPLSEIPRMEIAPIDVNAPQSAGGSRQ